MTYDFLKVLDTKITAFCDLTLCGYIIKTEGTGSSETPTLTYQTRPTRRYIHDIYSRETSNLIHWDRTLLPERDLPVEWIYNKTIKKNDAWLQAVLKIILIYPH